MIRTGKLGWALSLATLFLGGCGNEGAEAPAPESVVEPVEAPADDRPLVFTDRAVESGLDFVHFAGLTGEYYFPEMNGSGAALFDYDRDGDLDVYLTQGNFIADDERLEDAILPPAGPLPETDRLFRNDLEVLASGERRLRFTDVTEASGIFSTGYAMGVTTGDYNRDGWIDLYVANLRSNALLRNNGDGTFADVTAEAGVDDRRWTIPSVFFDFDRDGWLDLYVGNYVDFNMGTHKVCKTDLGESDWCGPLSFRSEPDSLFHNRGDGTFEDVTARAGLGGEFGNAMGATIADLNGDGRVDLYVANDGVPNQMWTNLGDGTFRNDALLAGAAVNEDGQPEASMGIDAADIDGDGDEDLLLTHLAMETNTVFLNDGQGFFEDVSVETGLANPSFKNTGFGTSWVDYDNDGLLDVLVVNGEVRKIEALVRQGSLYPLAQSNQLYHNLGGGRFEEVTEIAGDAFHRLEVSRGAAFGDVDNDGDTDVVVLNNSGPAELLINNLGHESGWVGLRALDPETGLEAIGANLGLTLDDGSVVWRRIKTSGSYGSARDPRVLIGLGTDRRPVKVEVQWPSGDREEFSGVLFREYNDLVRGHGSPLS